MHDALTDLPNRIRLEELLDEAVVGVDGVRNRIGLLVIDLDEFSQVSDAFGHASTDALLVQACRRIRGLLPESADAVPHRRQRVRRHPPRRRRRRRRHRCRPPADRRLRPAVPGRGRAAGPRPQHRRGRLPGARRRRAVAHPAHPHRPRHGPPPAQRVGAVRPDARPGHPAAPGAGRRAARGHRRRRARRVLPAQGRGHDRHRARRRGARPVGPSPPRPGAPVRVHRRGRAHRRHPQPDHGRHAPVAGRVPVVARPRAWTCRSRSTCRPATCSTSTWSTTWPRSSRRPACRPHALTLELTESHGHERLAALGRRARGSRRAGRVPVVRRLRHRLLVARPPAAAADRRDQDRPLVHRPHDRGGERPGHRPLGAGARPRPGPHDRRRGRRVGAPGSSCWRRWAATWPRASTVPAGAVAAVRPVARPQDCSGSRCPPPRGDRRSARLRRPARLRPRL